MFLDSSTQNDLVLSELKLQLQIARDELKKARTAAEAAARAKSDFFSVLVHEIRNPLTALIGFSELVATYSHSEEARLGYMQKIRGISNELTNFMDDLLVLSKVEEAMPEVELVEFSPLSLVQKLRELLLKDVQDKSLIFDVVVEGKIPETVLSDPTRLNLILTRLTENAIKFTERGGVTLSVQYHHFNTLGEEPRASAGRSLGQLEFRVIDTGCGIELPEQEKLFQLFARIHNVDSAKVLGSSGIGLSLARKAARELGGDVKLVSSTPHQGSVFNVFIDVREPRFIL